VDLIASRHIRGHFYLALTGWGWPNAYEYSEWHDGKLVIDANHRNIHLLQTACFAVKHEVQRRDAMVGC
jgi:hypothetical protein